MADAKVCPKCGATMSPPKHEMTLLASNDMKWSNNPVSRKDGMRVSPYHCPACQLVELYFVGSIGPT